MAVSGIIVTFASEYKEMVSILKQIFFFIALLLLFACNKKEDTLSKVIVAPWGVIAEESGDTMEHYSLKEILESGELIALTIPGEKSYYTFRNAEMGVQYMVGAKLAEELGVGLRVCECLDTLEMVDKLKKGEGDIILLPVRRDIEGADSLVFCGPEEDNSQWAVMEYNKELADTIDKWFNPEMIAEVQKQEAYILENGGIVQCQAHEPYVNKQAGIISEWDPLFKAYAVEASADWRLLAAICYQESSFDPKAKSWAGACGLMQLMPATAQTFGLEETDIFDPEANVQTAAQFLNHLTMLYRDVPDKVERLNFVLASYNGGVGHVRDAMALAEKNGADKYVWDDVSEFILKLSNPTYYRDDVVKHGYMRGTETHNYVASVRHRFEEYSGQKLTGNHYGAPQAAGYAGVSTEPTRRVAKTNKFQI